MRNTNVASVIWAVIGSICFENLLHDKDTPMPRDGGGVSANKASSVCLCYFLEIERIEYEID
jgi:hypothetical protein